jgi:uncharacterized protein
MPEALHFEDIVRQRMSRRGALRAITVIGGTAAVAASSRTTHALGAARASSASESTNVFGSGSASELGSAFAPVSSTGAVSAFGPGELTFDALVLNQNDAVTTATGFKHDIVISWGDPVALGAPDFDIDNQTPDAQALQFGFNNDYVAFLPLTARGRIGTNESDHGLLWVNHEYTSAEMMFPGLGDETTGEQKLIEIEAHGASVIEVSLDDETNTWTYNPNGFRNRRITGSTPMKLRGPAVGHRFLKTNADPRGRKVIGMFNQCGGGTTPWGSVLTTEENFNQYFANFDAVSANTADPDAALRAQDQATFDYSESSSSRGWETVAPRFDLAGEPNEVFRYGWIVEVDPYNPRSVPKKRTALGRFKHEGAAGTTASDGQYVVYMGDDQSGQFIYKFVSDDRVNTKHRRRNFGLLDSGTLYAARFDADGTGEWLALTFGTGPLVAASGWEDQAHVLLFARSAAAALGATPMDRPEDVEVNPVTGYVYAAMTGSSRTAADAANPRTSTFPNPNSPATNIDDYNGSGEGHVIEIREDGDDNAACTFSWEIFLLCGTPNADGTLDAATPGGAQESGRTYYGGFDESQVSPIARPDNVSFDSVGNLWIGTDGMPGSEATGSNHDTLFGVPTAGGARGHSKALASCPIDAEMTGPYFTPDDTSVFASIQHPGEDGTIAAPTSTWNSVTSASGGVCSRNAVIVVRRENGSSIPAGVNDPDPESPEATVPA